jgi:hypothetical protein
MPPGMPNTNPMITLEMPLDVFNKVQGVLAKRPFEETADMILGFRAQVASQIQQIQQEQAAGAGSVETGSPRPPNAPTRLRPVEAEETGG